MFAVSKLPLLILVTIQSNSLLPAQGPSTRTESQVASLAQTLISSGQLKEAQRILSQCLPSFPHSGVLYNLVGIAAAARNLNQAAEIAFLTALKFSPALTPAMLNLARVYHAEGKQNSAVAIYQRALRLDNGLVEAHANLAALLLERKDYAGTIRHIALLPPSSQTQNRYLAIKAAALAAMGNRDLAATIASQIDSSVTEQDVSLPVYVLGKLNQNRLLLTIASQVPLDNSSKELRGLLGGAYAKNGDSSKARSLYESVAHDDPSSPKPLIDAAHVAYDQHDFEGAAGYLIHAVRLKPQEADAQFFLGIVCVNLNLPADAIHALHEAVRLKPDNAAFNYALGAALLTSSDKDNSRQFFQKYIQLNPDDPHGRLAMGIADFEVGDLESAQNDVFPIVDDPRVSSGALYILGRICRQKDDFDGAEKYLRRAAAAAHSDATIYAHLGAVYIHKGDLLQARKVLDRALEIDSNNYLANESMLMLLQKQKDPAAKAQADRFAALTQRKSDEQQLLLRHIDAW